MVVGAAVGLFPVVPAGVGAVPSAVGAPPPVVSPPTEPAAKRTFLGGGVASGSDLAAAIACSLSHRKCMVRDMRPSRPNTMYRPSSVLPRNSTVRARSANCLPAGSRFRVGPVSMSVSSPTAPHGAPRVRLA